MGIDGDLNNLMENGTLSREGGLQAQMDKVKSECADHHHDSCRIMGSFRAINISEDVGLSGETGISGNTGISETIGSSGDISRSGAMGIFGETDMLGNTDISKASTKEAYSSEQQWATQSASILGTPASPTMVIVPKKAVLIF